MCKCVYSNSRKDVPRVAQWYGTIAAHTRRRASVLVVFILFCVHMYSFAGLIRRTPPPMFSDTAVTDHPYFPAQSSLGADILVYWIVKIVRTCAPGGSRALDFLRARRAPYPLGQALRLVCLNFVSLHIYVRGVVVDWLERLDYGAESRRKVVSSRLGFAMRRLENSLCQPSSKWVPFSN